MLSDNDWGCQKMSTFQVSNFAHVRERGGNRHCENFPYNVTTLKMSVRIR